jgi:sulfatase maturation enzyme AslB (radical SAM superfamily)
MQSDVRLMNFSVDSMDVNQYSRIRRGAKPLDQVLDNIRLFMKKNRELRPDIVSCISFALMRSNLDSIIPAINFAKENSISTVQCQHLIVFTPDMVEESALLDMERYSQFYERAVDHASQVGVQVNLPRPFKIKNSTTGHQPCFMPWFASLILGNGDVMVCCVPGTIVGNLHQESLLEIWRGEKLQYFRSHVNTSNPPESCSRCPMARKESNLESYVPGLNSEQREEFKSRVLSQRFFKN